MEQQGQPLPQLAETRVLTADVAYSSISPQLIATAIRQNQFDPGLLNAKEGPVGAELQAALADPTEEQKLERELSMWQARQNALLKSVVRQLMGQEEITPPEIIEELDMTMSRSLGVKEAYDCHQDIKELVFKVLDLTWTQKNLLSIVTLLQQAINPREMRKIEGRRPYGWWIAIMTDSKMASRQGWHEYQVDNPKLKERWAGKGKPEVVTELSCGIGRHFAREFFLLREVEESNKVKLKAEAEKFSGTRDEEKPKYKEMYFKRLIALASKEGIPVRNFRFLREEKDWQKFSRFKNDEPFFIKVMEKGDWVIIPIIKDLSLEPEKKVASPDRVYQKLQAFFSQERSQRKVLLESSEADKAFYDFLYQHTSDPKTVDKLKDILQMVHREPTHVLHNLDKFLKDEQSCFYTIRLDDEKGFQQAPRGEKTLGLCAGLGQVDLLWDEQGFARIKEWTFTHTGTEADLAHADMQSILNSILETKALEKGVELPPPAEEEWFAKKSIDYYPPFIDENQWQGFKRSLLDKGIAKSGKEGELYFKSHHNLVHLETALSTDVIQRACNRFNERWVKEISKQTEVESRVKSILDSLEFKRETLSIKEALQENLSQLVIREYQRFISPATLFNKVVADAIFVLGPYLEIKPKKPTVHFTVAPTTDFFRRRCLVGNLVTEPGMNEKQIIEPTLDSRVEMENLRNSSWGLIPACVAFAGESESQQKLATTTVGKITEGLRACTDQVGAFVSHQRRGISRESPTQVTRGSTPLSRKYLFAVGLEEPRYPDRSFHPEIPLSIKVRFEPFLKEVLIQRDEKIEDYASKSLSNEVIEQVEKRVEEVVFNLLMENTVQIVIASLPEDKRTLNALSAEDINSLFGLDEAGVQNFQKAQSLNGAIRSILLTRKEAVIRTL